MKRASSKRCKWHEVRQARQADKIRGCSNDFVSVLSSKVPIVTLSDALIQRLAPSDGRILRDRVLCGFCLKVGRRTKTFMVATSSSGKQVRMTLGRWPLLTTEDARLMAMEVLRSCRAGQPPARPRAAVLPTLSETLLGYCAAKGVKPSSAKRYDSALRVHFGDWLERPVTALGEARFAEHCHQFAQTKGAAVVELGRGLIGAVLRYANAVHHTDLVNPFTNLGAAGLLPARAKPRARTLQEADLPAWRSAVQSLPSPHKEYLLLLAFTGLRRNEGLSIQVQHVDFVKGVLLIPETKNGTPHTLPITPLMKTLLEKMIHTKGANEFIFKGVSGKYVSVMACNAGAPRFMLHDLRKLLATIGDRLKVGDAVIRKILNHTPAKSDVLYRHYVSVTVSDVAKPLEKIQDFIFSLMSSCGNQSND